jgi:NADH-quinone oxidoreductase subunit J
MSEILPEGLPLMAAVWAIVAGMVAGSALVVITRRNPVSAIAWLIVHFVSTAGLYLLLNSQFVAAIQVLVYGGAIIVLFLFVIMLLQVDKQKTVGAESGAGRIVLTAVAGFALLGVVGIVDLSSGFITVPGGGPPAEVQDTVEWLAGALFTRHLVAFELASIVLVAAMAGVLVYTTRRHLVGPSAGEK